MADDVTLRNRRAARHRRGDHSLCRPERGCGRRESSPDVIVPVATGIDPGLVAVVRRDLDNAGRLDTPLGRSAVELADRMCSGSTSASAVAVLSRELRTVLAEVLAGVPQADTMDELADRRRQRSA